MNDNTFNSTGPDGFIEIVLKGGARVAKEYCEAQLKESRFGKNPTIQILQIDGQPACMVLPSSDQAAKYQKAALLVVQYPQRGTLMLLTADKSHIRGFANTLRFVQ